MGKLLDKIRRIFINKRREYRQMRDLHRTAKRTKALREAERSDVNRWGDNNELLENWNERTRILAGMIPPNARVIEFGAGNMALKKYLPINCEYQGSDLVQRSLEMKICDLNMGIDLSLNPYDTAVFSGVLEYVYDIDKVFEQLKGEISRVVLSYACKDSFPVNREKLGWLSDYKKDELERIFNKHNYEIVNYQQWRKQSIYKLETQSFNL